MLVGILFVLTLTIPADAAKFTSFKSDAETVVFSLNGPIEHGDPKKFQVLLGQNFYAKNRILSLNSIGGWVHSAIELGLIVRHYGIKTVIPRNAVCISACSMVFVAGWDNKKLIPARFKHVRSQLGVHRPYQRNFQTADPEVINAVQSYLDFMKAGKKFSRLTMKTSSRSLRLIKNSELKGMGNYQIVGSARTRRAKSSGKKTSRARRSEKRQSLEQWRRSMHDNND